MKSKLLKIIIVTLLFSALLINGTNSNLSDVETSSNNNFSAMTLDFSLRDYLNIYLASPFFNWISIQPTHAESKNLRIKKDGSLDFKYSGSFVKTSGDDVLCDALQLETKLNGATKYIGNLSGFNLTPDITINPLGQDDWSFILTFSNTDASLQSKTCNFDFVFNGYQTTSDGSWGLTDQEVLGNTVSTGTWPPPGVAGSVVINEVMWMGSTLTYADEWIELRNTTGGPIDLTGWKIENAGDTSNPNITLSGTIPANGYFLLANYQTNHASSAINNAIIADQVTTSIELDNSGEQLTLKDGLNNVIDQTPSGSWPAGINTTNKQSMERNDDPSTGWHTCTNLGCKSTTFWDVSGNNYGTPKAANLSGEPEIELNVADDKKTLSFKVLNIANFKKLAYELTYDTNTVAQGIFGDSDLNNQDEYVKDNLVLGSCSSGGKCTYHTGIKNIKLKVNLTDEGGNTATLEKLSP